MEKTYIRNCKVREFENNILELYDSREGVVMDSYIGSFKNGGLFVALDTYETCYTSGLTVYTGGSDSEIWEIWENFAAKYDEEYTEV